MLRTGDDDLYEQARCASIARAGGMCLIVTGEESVDQVGRRALRLGANVDGVMVHADNDVDITALQVNA